ncbi:phosphatase PAP2 family protein [Flagellimonas aequoris]|uniref:PAP2 family protein n=1 Tax=Flagellimonas aequoris TaxID=2306997 RepID=A0A418NBQ0_9FLAO|nr:phosphatase PAP2 family protein [Allomuricauda aequoris]RIV73181.1 PAP2 family protein [Allomuricauda aequoris]TXK06989.1 phosphatase PAP2 family protein [Allomuricauda aequoris]
MRILKYLFVLMMAYPMFGQEKETNLWNDFTYDIGNIFGGVGYAYSRPFHWQGNDWANLGYLTGGTLLLATVDDEVNHWKNGFREDIPNLVIDYGNEYGSPENNYMLTGGVYLAGLFTKNEKLRRTGVLLISSATAGGFLQQVSKRIIGRARPKSGESSDTFDPFHLNRVYNYDSFPSGHAMLAFSNAYAIAKQFRSPWVKAGIYTVGLIPGFVRVVDDFHWFSDVAFSTVLSIFIVESIDRYLDSKYDEKYNNNTKQVSWNLSFGPNTMGVSLRF